jgi:hypothetical protein
MRKNRPRPASPEILTDRILRRVIISESNEKNLRRDTYWKVINMARLVLTAAAVFLIIFFITEQHGISTRIEKLEDNFSLEMQGTLQSNLQQARYQQITEMIEKAIPSDSLEEMLQINRRSLNFLLKRIRELENENLSFREKLLQNYNTTHNKSTINNEN